MDKLNARNLTVGKSNNQNDDINKSAKDAQSPTSPKPKIAPKPKTLNSDRVNFKGNTQPVTKKGLPPTTVSSGTSQRFNPIPQGSDDNNPDKIPGETPFQRNRRIASENARGGAANGATHVRNFEYMPKTEHNNFIIF